MENNRISIDDLVKQRFADREEEMPAGAWSRMEGLLDREMPVVPARRFGGWRKGGFFLLLASLAAGGGYACLQNEQLYPFSKEVAQAQPLPAHTGDATEISNTTGTTIPVKSTATAAIQPAADKAPETAGFPAVENEKFIASATNHRRINTKPVSVKTDLPTGALKSLKTPSVAALRQSELSVATGAKTASPIPAAVPEKGSASIRETAVNNLPETVAMPQQEAIAPLLPRTRDFGIKTAPQPHSIFDAARVPQLLQNLRDSYVSGMNRLNQIVAEQLSAAPVAAASATNALQPQAPANSKAAKPATEPALASPLPVATAAGTAESVASTQTDTALTPQQQEEANVAVNMATGILAGINSSIGSSGALQGIHLGLYQLLHLRNQWWLGAELRYFMRINNSMDLKDDYYQSRAANETVVMRNGNPYNAVRYDTDSVLSRYRFASYQSIELPVYLQYHRNRFDYYGGLNLGFHFRPNVTATSTRIATISRFDTLAAGTPLSLPPSRDAEVNPGDFDSRFSMGFLAGVQYRMTPALHLDLRLAQTLWDNRQQQSAGARRVSETYLKIPSVQFSVGYRLAGKKPATTK